MKRLRIAVVPLVLAPLMALVPAGSALAETQDAAGVSAPTMYFGIASVTDGIKVCFHGTAPVVGPWTAHIVGVRDTTIVAEIPISYDHLNPGSLSIDECPVISKFGTGLGEFEMTFEYLGASNGATIVRSASLHGVVWWQSGSPDAWIATSGG